MSRRVLIVLKNGVPIFNFNLSFRKMEDMDILKGRIYSGQMRWRV